MIKVLIDSGAGFVDYTKFVMEGTLQGDDLLNQPGSLDFVLTNLTNNFVAPVRSSYVKIFSTVNQISLATGFITVEPEKSYFGDSDGIQRLGYHIMVTSDEWLLNVKTVPFIPAFVNQTMGEILQRLAETLMPGFYTYDLDDGDVVPYFAYDPTKMWSVIAKQFADSIRYRYKVINRKIYFKPYGDLPLGISYDDSNTRPDGEWFDPYSLNTELLATPVINDAVVIGDVTALNILEDNFIGDGITSDFNMKQKVFRGASSLLLQENWDGQSFSTDLWNVVDPDNKFELAGALNLSPGTLPAVLGTQYILGNNGLELGGHLDLEHAELEFIAPFGAGIIGGVYSAEPLTLAHCKVGFMVTGGNIRPIVSGVLQPSLATIAVTGQHYVLQTSIDAGKWSRYNRKFRTLSGVTYGGDDVSATSDVTFLIQEVSTTQTTPVVLHQSEVIPVTLPSFGLYAPVNTINLNAAMTSTQLAQPPQGKLLVRSLIGPTGLQLPTHPENLTSEQKYILGFGLENQAATLQTTADVQQLRFYSDTIPGAGARIKLRTWQAGKAVGHVQDPVSIAAEGVIPGDDGIRSAMVTDLSPLPRTAAECELAGQAFIADRTQTQFNGSYKFPTQYLIDLGAPAASGVDYPRPGRFFNVISVPKGISNRDFIVRKVHFEAVEMRGEQINFEVEFGPDLYTDRLLPKFLAPKDRILTPEDSAQNPTPQELSNIGFTFLGDFTDATVTNVTGTEITVDLGQIPVTGAEVRRLDAGWGVNDRNRLLLTTAQTFTLDRAAYDQTYYIRQINGPKTSRYTTELRVVYPLVPSAPTGSIDTRDRLKPVVNLGLTGDIRNIFGIEVRSCMLNVSGATVSGAPVFAANIENCQEVLDLGLIADDPSLVSTVPIGSQNFTTARKVFTRSEFLFDYTLYPVGTTFTWEAVVTNASYRDVTPREIYIEKQMRGRTDNPNPTFIQTLTVPTCTHRQRIRFTQPFTGYLYDTLPPTVAGPATTGTQVDYTDAYRVWLQAEAPPVLNYNPATTIFPSSPFELHSLRLIASSIGAQFCCMEVPFSTNEGESNDDVGESSFSTVSTTYTDIPSATLWLYNASEWGTINHLRLQATVSCPETVSGGLVTVGLYDTNSTTIVASVSRDIGYIPGEAITVQSTFHVSGALVDGHTYTLQMKVTGPAVTGHFYKGRLLVVLNPLRKANNYWRYASGPGTDEDIRITDATGFAVEPGSFASRMVYNPESNAPLTGLFVEVVGVAGGSGGPSGWSMVAGGTGVNSSWVTTDPIQSRATGMSELGGLLYAGFNKVGTGSQVWVRDLGTGNWSKVGGDALNGSWANTGSPKKYVHSITNDGTNLYVALGTDTDGGAEVYKYVPGTTTWTKIGQSSSWTGGSYQTVFSVLCIGSVLYAGLGFGATDGTVWQYSGGGTSWTKIGGNGVNSGWTTGNGIEVVFWLANYNGQLVAGLGFSAADGEVWRWNGSTWTKIGGDGVNGSWSGVGSVTSMVGDGATLYAAIGNGGIWSFNGSTWTEIGDGSGLNGSNWWTNSTLILGMFSGTLYAGGSSTLTFESPGLWAFVGGTWSQVAGDSINGSWGDIEPDNVPGVENILDVDGTLYVSLGMGAPIEFSTTDGIGDIWALSSSGGPFAMVDAGLQDGRPTQELPGWFGYTSGDPVPAQTYTVNTNMAFYVNELTAVDVSVRDTDDYFRAMCGIIFSAWQFELFAAVIGAAATAGKNAINSLRDTIIAGYVAAINTLTTNQFDWVQQTAVTLVGGSRQLQRAVLSSSQILTSGNRYYGAPNSGIQQALLVYQVTAVDPSEIDTSGLLPVPEAPTVLVQRRFTAPSDLAWIFDNNPYRVRDLCFKAFFFNTMWEYSPELELSTSMVAPPVPVIEVISVLSIDIQIRLNVVATDDTQSVTVEMSPTSLFVGPLVRVKGGPLQSVYSLHVPTGPNTPVVGQYIRARRTDYLGSSDWSAIVFVSQLSIQSSSFLSALGVGTIVSNPLNNLFSYVSTGTTITWSWPTFTLTYSDGFVQYVQGGTYTAFTGLASSTTFKFYPYLQGTRQASSTVFILLSTVSGGTAEDPSATATTNADGNTPLSRGAMDGSTTSGGAGSGSGGGIG